MFTHVAKCINNFIRVPPISPGPLEVILPVVIAKKEQSFLFSTVKPLPAVPKNIREIKPYVNQVNFNIMKNFVIFDLEISQDVFYVIDGRVMVQGFSDVFSDAIPVPGAREGMEVRADVEAEIFYNSSDSSIFEQVLVNMSLQLIEYRNIIL
ncbi:MAG: hypothetical protein PWR06_1288 [Thermoanaerobacteraceae bacterium]|uniref:SipL SPOCS domain-containing protein n=1 Tax=Biomaibacter acetigenes TaxID=2316383 RepID=A0A3G2R1D5_9FIRM|nr:hypothetical protein D2962_00445 [Biomaibacter acetigenes]MDK2878572.1 hypothetical protein [Thermoanaerobacteraceae bacterium]